MEEVKLWLFRPISRFISKTVQDRAKIIMGKTNRNAHGVRTHANKRASKSVLRNVPVFIQHTL